MPDIDEETQREGMSSRDSWFQSALIFSVFRFAYPTHFRAVDMALMLNGLDGVIALENVVIVCAKDQGDLIGNKLSKALERIEGLGFKLLIDETELALQELPEDIAKLVKTEGIVIPEL